MEYWIIIDNVRRGPMSAREVCEHNITPETPVWRSGLSDWTTLGQLPEFAPEFAGNSAPEAAAPDSFRAAAAPAPVVSPKMPEGECPSSRLVWCIVVTVLCCMPLGVLGIIFASKVQPAWYSGNVAKAYKMQQRAEMCIILSIVLGLLWLPLQTLWFCLV